MFQISYLNKYLDNLKHALNARRGILHESKAKKTEQRTTICSAISSKHVITFYCRGGFRFMEPHCLGVLSDGDEALLSYQVGGYDRFDAPIGWKLFRSSDISRLGITHEHFTYKKPETGLGYDSRYSAFTTIYCQIQPGMNDESKPIIPAKPEESIKNESLDYEQHEEHVPAVLTHNERMRKFRFSHIIFPWRNKS